MANPSIQVEYHQGLEPVENVLSKVKQPGDFFIRNTAEVPMPRVEMDGVGVVSFPVPEPQIRQLIQHAERAPYGRGEETMLDTSVQGVASAADEGASWRQVLGET